MAYHHHINIIGCSVRKAILLLVLSSIWEASNGWRWKSGDAIIQDVWPEEEVSSSEVNVKVALPRSIGAIESIQDVLANTEPKGAIKGIEEIIEDDLVFEGRYFQPTETRLPPPPPFMVWNNNWRGSVGVKNHLQHGPKETLLKHSKPNNYFLQLVGVGEAPPQLPPPPPLPIAPLPHLPPPPPPTQKFTSDNVKLPKGNGISKQAPEEKLHSSSNFDPKTVSFTSSSPLELPPLELEEIMGLEEQDLKMLESFKDASKCFTPTDREGRCIPFRQCFPVVFNVINGELRNPGLAKLFYQGSGPCNASLELDFALRKLITEKEFLQVDFYNQTVCCPGFKKAPLEKLELPNLWLGEGEVRSARLIPENNTTLEFPKETPPFLTREKPSSKNQSSFNDEAPEEFIDPREFQASEKLDTNASRNEANVSMSIKDEGGHNESSTIAWDHGESDDDDEWEAINVYTGRDSDGREEGDSEKEERRGDRDKVEVLDRKSHHHHHLHHHKRPTDKDPVSAIPAPNLSPITCRQQIYGIPRGHWPWMVALVIRSRHICSGALIDEKHVLTAQHCVHLLSEPEVRKLRIIIGDRVMYSSIDGPHLWRKVNKVITHVNYNQQTFGSDIAILRLNSAVPFSRNIQPITLPQLSSADTSIVYGKGIVAGWSGADIGQPAFEARAEVETVVDIMDKGECREIYRGFALSGLPLNTFCTRPANNTCVADSGAPLVVRVQNCWQLLGIFSWGLGCNHFPEVFTDVSRYLSWIRTHTRAV